MRDMRNLFAILREMWPENRLVLSLMLLTGEPISDILDLIPADLDINNQTVIINNVSFWLPEHVFSALRRISSAYYIFPHRLYANRHRTRQAVYKDFRRAKSDLGLKIDIYPQDVRRLYVPLS